MIKELVETKIKEIETAENVEVLFAVESGSRAWGVDSPDSDYDIRFVYRRQEDDYLKLEGIRDVIEWQLDETLDINGWDIQKVLRLLYRSNPTVFEWFNSKIVYYKTDTMDLVKEILPQYFSKKKGIYHYLNMAKTNNKQFIQNGEHMIEIKKYFYVLRSVLACRWIMDRNINPPMEFSELIDYQLSESLRPVIKELMNKKANIPELKMIVRNTEIDQFITDNLVELEDIVKNLPDDKFDWEILNSTFVRIVK